MDHFHKTTTGSLCAGISTQGYTNLLGSTEATEKAIKTVKDMFQNNLSAQLALLRVTAPMVVLTGTGINDDLNGVERPVRFPIKDMGERQAEVVHSLAKWKRLKLGEMKVEPGRGIYTDMNALRPDEELDNLHSIYVDQWDWEAVIRREDRNLDFLKKTVRPSTKPSKSRRISFMSSSRSSGPPCRKTFSSSTRRNCCASTPA